ncbi:MAG: FmdB family zinc ribbon protein [Thermodesulfobacteriota bacterium]
MPIYEYQCKKCDKVFETLVMSGETPECPECSSTEVSRLMSACGFVSKGAATGGGEAPTLSSSAGSACSGCSAGSCSSCGI